MNGVLLVDKASGCTSHDVVRRLRRVCQTRSVGHAGTLDPMATGVLVIGVGASTRLLHFLTADDKAYEAEIRLGVSTHSLDADGEVDGEAPVPPLEEATVIEAMNAFHGEHDQRAPKVSAIKKDGKALHKRVRAGEDVEAPVRRVRLDEVSLLGIEGDRLRVSMSVGKGFYVRAFARDLAASLGTLGHLTALRRTRSGAFSLERAVPQALLEADLEDAREAARAQILSPIEACTGMGVVQLTEQGEIDAGHGRLLREIAIEGAFPGGDGPFALVSPGGRLAAIGGRFHETALKVLRGFPSPE